MSLSACTSTVPGRCVGVLIRHLCIQGPLCCRPASDVQASCLGFHAIKGLSAAALRRYHGLLAQRFALISSAYRECFEECFRRQYALIHRLETNKLRNVAKVACAFPPLAGPRPVALQPLWAASVQTDELWPTTSAEDKAKDQCNCDIYSFCALAGDGRHQKEWVWTLVQLPNQEGCDKLCCAILRAPAGNGRHQQKGFGLVHLQIKEGCDKLLC